jgi:hypothetical protein
VQVVFAPSNPACTTYWRGFQVIRAARFGSPARQDLIRPISFKDSDALAKRNSRSPSSNIVGEDDASHEDVDEIPIRARYVLMIYLIQDDPTRLVTPPGIRRQPAPYRV